MAQDLHALRDDQYVPSAIHLGDARYIIEQRRVELGKTSGFERLYARVTRLYFGGMARHLSGLRARLVPSAQLAYVVGDQASYFRVIIHTGDISVTLPSTWGI